MKILILGAAGMLGHKLYQAFEPDFETWGTVRTDYHAYARYNIFKPNRLLGGVDVFNFDTMIEVVGVVKPDVVINCIGIIKQLRSAKNPIISLTINSLLPHRLANLCQAAGARLLHISTDCVFSGRQGMYTEADVSDAEDLYGRTKFLGEVDQAGCLTLRTSIIGRELQTTSGLIEWFLSNKGQTVQGYTRAIYSGFTTLALARIIAMILQDQPDLSGLYQVSSEPINKYDLLLLAKDAFDLKIDIEPQPSVAIDRSLDSSKFRAATDFTPEPWPAMIRDMATDPTPYQQWRTDKL